MRAWHGGRTGRGWIVDEERKLHVSWLQHKNPFSMLGRCISQRAAIEVTPVAVGTWGQRARPAEWGGKGWLQPLPRGLATRALRWP